jgi:hypothetical protein
MISMRRSMSDVLLNAGPAVMLWKDVDNVLSERREGECGERGTVDGTHGGPEPGPGTNHGIEVDKWKND